MPVYSIFQHDNEPVASEGRNPPGSTLDFRHLTPSLGEPSIKSSRGTGALDSSLPEVVLQLPDLLTATQASTWATWIANQVFWIGIILGALLALVLIWSDRKPAERQVDEAPVWTNSSTVLQADVGSSCELPVATGQSEWAPPAPEDDDEPGSATNAAPPEPTPEDSLDNPPTQDAAPPTPESPAARTARSEATVWDGNSNQVKPGEAAPVGRIINTVVPQ